MYTVSRGPIYVEEKTSTLNCSLLLLFFGVWFSALSPHPITLFRHFFHIRVAALAVRSGEKCTQTSTQTTLY